MGHTQSYLSRPDRVGVSTSVTLGATGCCGFKGPYPSATLDKIPNQVVIGILEDSEAGSNFNSPIFGKIVTRHALTGLNATQLDDDSP